MNTETKSYDTSRTEILDLTADARSFASAAGGDGLLHLFAPHATAGLALIETGSGTEEDLGSTLDRLLPVGHRYVHSHGTRGHGRDHVIPAFISPSLTLPVVNGEVQLGTWQSIVLVDPNRDNPNRTIRYTFVAG
ncbi:MAG: YjbQ family protein [Actinomycetota bacterium]|nr:YjbQ family protein [Actinomycetota bacterium]